MSNIHKLSQGVLQGSVLSPILFCLYLAGIEKIVSRSCEIGLFADDIALWRSGPDVSTIETDINFTLEDVWKFSKDHKLNFNPTKSIVSFFYH